MNNHRIFVEKKPGFQLESKSLMTDFLENLNISIKSLRLINVYDIYNIDLDTLNKAKVGVFSEANVDNVSDSIDLDGLNYFANEFLPGQFDQRADSAIQCIKIINSKSNPIVQSSKLLIFDKEVSKSDISKIKKYYINTVESREKDMSLFELYDDITIAPVNEVANFIKLDEKEIGSLLNEMQLAMSLQDLLFVKEYFKTEERNPTVTEIKILDTYWSDHCRHTTFETMLSNVTFSKDKFNVEIENTFKNYLKMRSELKRTEKPMTLMDLATINVRYERMNGNLDDLEVSSEINACSIYIDVKVDGKTEKWLLMFKNETHNHPTEIEPFGGASTCIGGAIRDPLSGRSYVYGAMRVTGAADITESYEDTLENKLPQRVISKVAAHGYSSYGNQIGLATTHVREIYHSGYKAKRMEIGAVVGAAPVSHVKREEPVPGDIIVLLGGKTGRDGIGGATGSSKEHTENSLERSSAEVQKGNAPEERKIQRLFRNSNVTKLIKKSNDFGAGGVSVAIGELADGLEINLDKVPVKYLGLNGTELSISESQERMAVVIEPKDLEKFIELCTDENIDAIKVADVTDSNRLIIVWQGKNICDISREFIDTAGIRQTNDVTVGSIEDKNPFTRTVKGSSLKDKILNNLSDLNVANQKGLIEMFDSTIGATTVLMPFGGKHQLSPTQASVQKIPVIGNDASTCSVMAYGFDPYLSEYSPYHGAQFSVVTSIAKTVATGADYKNIRFTFQEYFERLNKEPLKWGKPFAALLGASSIMSKFKLAAIGGKDSMSGTYKDINVPPTLVSFAVTTADAKDIISTDFKKSNNYIYLIKHNVTDIYTPDTEQLMEKYSYVNSKIISNNIVSAYAVEYGGISEALCKMSFGNKIGFKIDTEEDLFAKIYGSIIVESNIKLDEKIAILLGKTTDSDIIVNEEIITHDELITAWDSKLTHIYPTNITKELKTYKLNSKDYTKKTYSSKDNIVKVIIPVFPGTNCEYDTARAFEMAGATVNTFVFNNQSEELINKSIIKLAAYIDNSNILALAGGFSSGDEPDGSGKFIATILSNSLIKNSVHKLLERKGLILGICNGFQALVKSGLLPNGSISKLTNESPTLYRNDILRHVSSYVNTLVSSVSSPWLSSFKKGDIHSIPVSHGEGKFVVSDSLAKELFDNGQVAFQYCDFDGIPTSDGVFNPNGSSYAIEGIISKCGQILGKMGHSERYGENLAKNISGEKVQSIFKNAVNYFKNNGGHNE